MNDTGDTKTTIDTPGRAESFVTAQVIAQHLGVSSRGVLRWARGGCPHLRRNRVVRFQLSAVLDWLKEEEHKRGRN